MLYRRKILLAFIEAFGSSLTYIDCQKLLFLFCMRSNRKHYDFFPYTYGSHSFLLDQDRKRLVDAGMLTSSEGFQLSKQTDFIQHIQKQDREALYNFVGEIGDLRGEEIVYKAYLEYPYYASHSITASTLLKDQEYTQVCRARNTDTAPCLFTIGYEGLSIDAYLNILVANNVLALIDVRKNPLSRKEGFSKGKLASYTHDVGIAYFHLPELGVPSLLRRNLDSVAAYQTLFDYYVSQILPGEKDAIETLKGYAREHKRIALTCFEADHHFCHRHKIVEYLEHDPSFTLPMMHLDKTFAFDSGIRYTDTDKELLCHLV